MGDFARYLAFGAVVGLLVYVQYYLAHRQWRAVKGGQASEIDVSYVRSENYFAQSFRMKLGEWVKLPASNGGNGERIVVKGAERIRIVSQLEMEAEAQSDDILVINGDFSCGTGCGLTREVCVHGNANIGAGSQLQSLAADGSLELGDAVAVARWIDSGGEMHIGRGCQVGSRATSLKRIRLGFDAVIASAYAPEVATTGWLGEFPGAEPPSQALLAIDFASPAEGALHAVGLPPEKFHQLSPECSMYNGDVFITQPAHLTTSLIVKGDCYIAAGSVIDADLKVTGFLSIGPGAVCNGNLVADGRVYLAPGCRFSGLIHSGTSILLSQGARGVGRNGLIAVHAQEELSVEGDVAIQGKLSAGDAVKAVRAAAGEAWRQQARIHKDGSRANAASA